jgi:hypothetical protein
MQNEDRRGKRVSFLEIAVGKVTSDLPMTLFIPNPILFRR